MMTGTHLSHAKLRLAVAVLSALGPTTGNLFGQGLHVGPETPTKEEVHTKPQAGSSSRRPTARRNTGPARILSRSLAIRAVIQDGVATTDLTQVFRNVGGQSSEAIWVLPLPRGATADQFTMTMNGKQVAGDVLDAKQARRIYTGIVRRQRDPGLLEYMGNGCLRARVFPILPGKDMRVEVRYRQVLPATDGLFQWQFPLGASQAGGQLPHKTTLDLRIRSKKALKNVYSPNPGVDVLRKGDHEARVSMELSGGVQARRYLDVFYGTSDAQFGLDLLTYREKGKPGYFLMMLSPQMAWKDEKALPKCINFVVDTSGSMKGKKIEQARGALKFFLNSLNEGDHFNVIPFSTEARPFFPMMQLANSANIAKALDRAAGLTANGGTNIHQALTSALAAGHPTPTAKCGDDDIRPLGITVFLTDGRPTVGQANTDDILRDVKKHNKEKHRVFVFGVGNDVNSKLLDRIAKASRGDRDYVRPHESIETKTSALFRKLSHPVMSDVRIDCAGIQGFEIHPQTTPDLFRGSRLLLTGRYEGHGNHAVRLHGQVRGKSVQFIYEGSFSAQSGQHDFIPTLWAQRKVAMLLDNVRLHGEKKELIDEVRRLGKEHGIVTQYSSHLVLEAHGKRRVAGIRYRGPGDVSPPRPGPASPGRGPRTGGPGTPGSAGPSTGGPGTTTGSDEFYLGSNGRPAPGKRLLNHIDYSVALRDLAKSRKVLAGKSLRRIHGHTFHHLKGVWVDAAFKAEMKKEIRKINAFSADYFALLKAHPKLSRAFSLGPRILIVLDGKAIEIQ